MAVYAVIGVGNLEALKTQIATQYGATKYEFANNVWFVSDAGTTKDVADKLGISKGDNGVLGVVLRFDAYSGRAPATTWTWLQAFPGMISNG
jgi:hypothetical protein